MYLRLEEMYLHLEEMRATWNIEKVQLALIAPLLAMAIFVSALLLSPSRAKLSFQASEEKFLEVPHIVWGLNNQKIAIARAALTARYLNRTLIAPTLTSSVFINASDAMSFTHLFSIPRFNNRCKGFVKITATPATGSRLDVPIGSGRKWTPERDTQHLSALSRESAAVIKLVGRNPFLWPDHWPVKDYARVLECLTLTNSLQSRADRIVGKLRKKANPNPGYAAVHMRVERDWQLHCRHLEDRAVRITKTRPHICATKEEIVKRVATVLPKPAVVYLAAAHPLMNLTWGDGIVPVEKTNFGVGKVYQKLSYIMQSAIDFEICKRADVFAGNSYSTFSSLVVMARTVEMTRRGAWDACRTSFAYNVGGDHPRPWVTNMSEPSLKTISYGSDDVGC